MQRLRNVEFSIIHFTIEFQESIHLSLEILLRLRRDLREAGRHALSGRTESTSSLDPFVRIFDPPISSDPVGVKRHQKTGPPFALHFSPDSTGEKNPGDSLELSVVFWGDGVQEIANFARTLQVLGSAGLHRREGIFDLIAIEGEGSGGVRACLWREGGSLDVLAPVILDAQWRTQELSTDFLRLVFITPARLISSGKPLFRPDFHRIFPFILRRVTSMCFAYCAVEPVKDIAFLMESASRVDVLNNHLQWQDWRSLPGDEKEQNIGGVLGSIDLFGTLLGEVAWVLSLGSLLNVGKGAAFGAGQFRLEG